MDRTKRERRCAECAVIAAQIRPHHDTFRLRITVVADGTMPRPSSFDHHVPVVAAGGRDGEHDDYDDDVQLAVVRDPETKRIVMRAYLCGDHRAARRDDGYEVIV